jgi:hypothetical protein
MPQFKKGNPGGPGRRHGSRNRVTLIREAISDQDRIGVVRAMIKKAHGGDVPAGRLMLPLIWPAGTYVNIDLPPMNDAAGIAEAQARVVALMNNEELSLEEADSCFRIIENRRRALETAEIERNLRQAQDNLAERERLEKKSRR